MSKRPESPLKRFRRLGFDQSYYSRSTRHYHIRCSKCQAMVINGVATHERGCPNHPKFNKEDE